MRKIISAISFVLVLTHYTKGQEYAPSFLKAEFSYGIDELDQITSFLQTFPYLDRGTNVSVVKKVTVPIQFVISPNGIISSIKPDGFVTVNYRWKVGESKEKYVKSYFRQQAIAICRSTEGLWIPAERDGVACSDTIIHDFVFEWKNRDTYNWFYGFEEESDEINFFYTPNKETLKEITDYKPFFLFFNSRPRKDKDAEFDKTIGIMWYNFGLEKLKEQKFFIAQHLFKMAYMKHPQDDCLYNLSVAQLSLGWDIDACANLNQLISNGDEEAKRLSEKYCK